MKEEDAGDNNTKKDSIYDVVLPLHPKFAAFCSLTEARPFA